MSAVAILRALMIANGAATLNEVSANRIVAGDLPQGTILPAITLRKISAVETPVIDAGAADALTHSRVQITAHAKDYPGAKRILKQIRAACSFQRGLIAMLRVDCIQPDIEGPDDSNPDAGTYEQSIDFIVLHHEPR